MAEPLSVAQAHQIDRTAIELLGIPRLLLMEHAGAAVARIARAMASSASAPIGICCGAGFNGGDGLAAARHLHDWGYPLHMVMTTAPERLRDEPRIYATILKRLGVSFQHIASAEDVSRLRPMLRRCGLLIDALLGIGASGAVREPMASLIAAMNDAAVPILAVDVPSGLDADSGAVQGIAVKATQTVTFGRPKRGMVLQDGPSHVGAVTVDAITIPHHLLSH